jgi:hypothetical protein
MTLPPMGRQRCSQRRLDCGAERRAVQALVLRLVGATDDEAFYCRPLLY